jgi:glucose-fructose oxidoreductase
LARNWFIFQNAFSRIRSRNRSGKEGLADVRIIRALLESQDKNRPVRISPVGKVARPTEDQENHKPPVGKPHLVKAVAPSK